VTAVSTSADGSYIVSGNAAGSIDFFDASFSRETYLWRVAARDRVRSVAISDDGSYVVAGSNDGVIYFMDRELLKRAPLWKFQTAGAVFSVSISSDGSYVAAGSHDDKVHFMDSRLTENAPLWSHRTEGDVRSVSISGDGTYIAAGSEDAYLYFFEKSYRGNTFLWRLKTSTPALKVAMSYDGNYVVAGCVDGYIYFANRDFTRDSYLWRYQTGSRITSVSISSDGSYVAAGNSDGYIYIFDRELSANSYVWRYNAGEPVEAVAISRNGVYIVCAAGASTYLFDAGFTGENYVWSYDAQAEVTSISISSSGNLVVAGDGRGILHTLEHMIRSTVATTMTQTSTAMTETVTAMMPLSTTATEAVAPTLTINPYTIPVTLLIAALAILGFYMRRRVSGKKLELESASRAALGTALQLAPRKLISTGTRVLDELTMGGFPRSYSVILSSPSCDQRDLAVKRFLSKGLGEEKFALCLTTDVTKYLELIRDHPKSFHLVLCNPHADALAPPFSNISKTKGVENLTEINIALMKVVDSLDVTKLKEERAYIDVLSDVLLLHGGPTVRRWISDLVPRLKARGFTVLGMINPSMHRREETEAVSSIFDGEVEIFERETEGRAQRFIAVRRFYGLEYSDQERII